MRKLEPSQQNLAETRGPEMGERPEHALAERETDFRGGPRRGCELEPLESRPGLGFESLHERHLANDQREADEPVARQVDPLPGCELEPDGVEGGQAREGREPGEHPGSVPRPLEVAELEGVDRRWGTATQLVDERLGEGRPPAGGGPNGDDAERAQRGSGEHRPQVARGRARFANLEPVYETGSPGGDEIAPLVEIPRAGASETCESSEEALIFGAGPLGFGQKQVAKRIAPRGQPVRIDSAGSAVLGVACDRTFETPDLGAATGRATTPWHVDWSNHS